MSDTGSTLTGRILLTGGTGTLGRAFLKQAATWDCQVTVFSRDPMKQAAARKEFPNVRFVLGDVRDYNAMLLAMTGHDIVIHAAAQKHIPFGEANAAETHEINVNGSYKMAMAAIQAGVDKVVAISTDKVCYPVNVYGASKFLMERLILEAGQNSLHTTFHLCRYGNVMSSTGSVLEVWERQVEAGVTITVTDREMTRFWMTPRQAVDLVVRALDYEPNCILIPKIPALTMEQLAFYTYPSQHIEEIGLRPGEKRHERLVTREETRQMVVEAIGGDQVYVLLPGIQRDHEGTGYTSDIAPELTRPEFMEMLREVRDG